MLPSGCQCCPHKEVDLDLHTTELEVIRYLSLVLEDEEGTALVKRNLLLAYHYLGLWRDEMDIEEVQYMSKCLLFFSANLNETKEYREVLVGFLGKCQRPIIMNKSSDLILEKSPMPLLFTSLGKCFIYLREERNLQLLLLDILRQVIFWKKKPPKEVRPRLIWEAVKISDLLECLIEGLEHSTDLVYNELLGFLYKIVKHCSLGERLLSLGCFDKLVSKLNLQPVLRPVDIDKKNLTSNLLWLMLEQREENRNHQIPPIRSISSESVTCLKMWFQRDIMHGRDRDRSSIVSLILKVFLLYPNIKLLNHQLIQDIILIATASDFGTDNTWAEGIKFSSLDIEMRVKKILITIICYEIEKPLTQLISSEKGVLTSLSFLLDPSQAETSIQWKPWQRMELIIYGLHALPIIARHLHQEYSISGATTRILNLIECFSQNNKNLIIVRLSCECLYSLTNIEKLRNHFIALPIGPTLIDNNSCKCDDNTEQTYDHLIFDCPLLEGPRRTLIQSVVLQGGIWPACKKDLIESFLKEFNAFVDLMTRMLRSDNQITLLIQSILENACHILSFLGCSDTKMYVKYGFQCKTLGVVLLKRLHSPCRTDSKIENGLLIAAGDFIWNCVVPNRDTRNDFITNEGIYMILDLVEDSIEAVQFYYLSIIADCCFNRHCISQIVTWRGKKADTNVLSLMCKLWRRQEEKKGVMRNDYGCIDDIECALKGEKQKEIEITGFSTIPALVDMVGCMRTKIASIVYLITREFHDISQLSRSIYLVPYDTLERRDQITLEIIKFYEELKEGEMFWELQDAFEVTKVSLVPTDLMEIHSLVMRHMGTANCIRNRQIEILQTEQKVKLQEEEKLYGDINESEMMKTLQKATSIKKYLMLSNFEFREKHKIKHKDSIEAEVSASTETELPSNVLKLNV